jgi:hypothetical protein
MKNIDRYESRKGRKIVVDGVEWKWHIGDSHIEAYSVAGDRRVDPTCVVLGIAYDEWVQRKWKQSNSQAVTPEVVADWLRYT